MILSMPRVPATFCEKPPPAFSSAPSNFTFLFAEVMIFSVPRAHESLYGSLLVLSFPFTPMVIHSVVLSEQLHKISYPFWKLRENSTRDILSPFLISKGFSAGYRFYLWPGYLFFQVPGDMIQSVDSSL